MSLEEEVQKTIISDYNILSRRLRPWTVPSEPGSVCSAFYSDKVMTSLQKTLLSFYGVQSGFQTLNTGSFVSGRMWTTWLLDHTCPDRGGRAGGGIYVTFRTPIHILHLVVVLLHLVVRRSNHPQLCQQRDQLRAQLFL